MRLVAYNAVTKEGKVENNQCPQGAEIVTTARPESTPTRPEEQRSRVDLPEPDRPMTDTHSPGATWKETPLRWGVSHVTRTAVQRPNSAATMSASSSV